MIKNEISISESEINPAALIKSGFDNFILSLIFKPKSFYIDITNTQGKWFRVDSGFCNAVDSYMTDLLNQAILDGEEDGSITYVADQIPLFNKFSK